MDGAAPDPRLGDTEPPDRNVVGGSAVIAAVMMPVDHEADTHRAGERVDRGKPMPIRCRGLVAHQDVGPNGL